MSTARDSHVIKVLEDFSYRCGKRANLDFAVGRTMRVDIPQTTVNALLGYRVLVQAVVDVGAGMAVRPGRSLAIGIFCLEHGVRREQPVRPVKRQPFGLEGGDD